MTPYFQVGDKKFSNKFLALKESARSHVPVHFNLFDSAFDSVSWDEPALSWDQLLDIRAHQIASKNRPIVLNFSGGTDSYTIYQVFKRNNITIDIIRFVVKKDNILAQTVPPAMTWLKENNDPRTKIIVVDDYIDELRDMYSTPDWCWNTSQRLHFGLQMSDRIPISKQDPSLRSLTEYSDVYGYEKPRLLYSQGEFYSYQEDTAFANSMDQLPIENFFISPDLPELHVKQSYILARYIANLALSQKRSLDFFNNIHACFGAAYYDYAIKGCGRFGDFANSAVQKESQRTSALILNNNIDKIKFSGRIDVALTEGLRTGETYAVNYIKGLHNLRQDPILQQFFRHEHNIFSVVDLQSKKYKLNFRYSQELNAW